MGAAPAENIHSVQINGVDLDINEQGSGAPLLFLHPGHPLGRFAPDEAALAALAKSFRVIAPTHPGFGHADAPDWMTNVDDLAYFYLDLLKALDLQDVVLVGASLGGWIAAEIAVKSTARLSRLVLANPVGIKIGDRETRDFVDIYAIFDKEIAELAYADPSIGTPDIPNSSDETLFHMARSREATARYGWSPFLHNPKLKSRLHRIDIPTLVLFGAADRITREGYCRAYADCIPGARFATMTGAGHFPHKETPNAFAEAVSAFVAGKEKELVS
nr:MAG: alpha/beta hydrolase [Hyphomicrobiales bacterium]